MVLLCALFLQAPLVNAYAEPSESQITLKQATETALESFGGEVLKTETAEQDGRSVYKIRLVKNGRVKEILIDIHNGEVLNL